MSNSIGCQTIPTYREHLGLFEFSAFRPAQHTQARLSTLSLFVALSRMLKANKSRVVGQYREVLS